VTGNGLAYEDRLGAGHQIAADTVMPTGPLQPNEGLYAALRGKIPEVYLVGDGKEPGMIVHAVRSGYHTAKAI
jgi:2-enoate reductase